MENITENSSNLIINEKKTKSRVSFYIGLLIKSIIFFIFILIILKSIFRPTGREFDGIQYFYYSFIITIILFSIFSVIYEIKRYNIKLLTGSNIISITKIRSLSIIMLIISCLLILKYLESSVSVANYILYLSVFLSLMIYSLTIFNKKYANILFIISFPIYIITILISIF